MADDLDVEALLEAPYKRGDEVNGKVNDVGADKENRKSSSSKKKKRSRSHSRDKRSRSRSHGRPSGSPRRRSRSPPRRSSRSRDRRRSSPRPPVRERPRRSRSRDRRRRSSPARERIRKSRSRSPRRESKKRKSRSRSPPNSARHVPVPPPASSARQQHVPPASSSRSLPGPPPHRAMARSPLRPAGLDELTPEERDMRTVFCMQLSQRVRTRDLEEFFSAVGKVRDVRIIMDNKTRRSKGIAYIEFANVDSVPLALGLSGQRVVGVPIIVQPTQAEKNRAAASATTFQKGNIGPMRLYVGSLHFNITEEMLRGIFEPFGKIANIELVKDPETGRSHGYGFITFHDSEDAKKALEQLNGFELAGRPMKVGHVTERSDTAQGPSFLDSDELDRAGIDLGATGRLQLMAKLAEGTGFQLPQAAVTALQMTPGGLPGQQNAAPPIATQCFMLSNMFEPATEANPTWDIEIRNDVVEECRKHGGALHVFVDRASPQGNVYVKCPSIAAAVASVNALHGRWFAGRIITAAYVPVLNYHSLFPDAVTPTTSL